MMGWQNSKVFRNELKYFWVLGSIGVLEILNIGFLESQPYKLSMIVSAILFALGVIAAAMLCMDVKEKYKNYLLDSRADLAGKFEGVSKEMAETEERLSKMSGDYYRDITEKLNQFEERLTASVMAEAEEIKRKVDSAENNVSAIVAGAKEALADNVRIHTDEVKQETQRLHEEAINQAVAAKEQIVSGLAANKNQLELTEKTLSESIGAEGAKAQSQLGETREILIHTLNESANMMQALSGKIQESALSAIEAEGNRVSALIGQVNERLETESENMKGQAEKSLEKILGKTSELEDAVLSAVKSEGNEISALIGNFSSEFTEQNGKALNTILQKTGETGSLVIETFNAEVQKAGLVINEAKEQVAASIEELAETAEKSADTLLAKASGKYEAVMDALGKGFESAGEHAQKADEGFNWIHETISGLIRNTNESIQDMKQSSDEKLHAMNEGLGTKLTDVAARIDEADGKNETRFGKAMEFARTATDSFKGHHDETIENTRIYLTNRINEVAENRTAEVIAKVTGIGESTANALKAVESNIITDIKSVGDGQTELREMLAESIRNETENFESLILEASRLYDRLAELNNEAYQKVLSQFSAHQNEQFNALNEDREAIEERLSTLDRQIAGLAGNLSETGKQLGSSFAETITLIDSLKETETGRGEEIAAILAIIHGLEANLGNSVDLLAEKQEALSEKVDSLSSQVGIVHGLMNILQQKSLGTPAAKEKRTGKLRIEEIKDDENGIRIINKYHDEVLAGSEMYQNSQKVYEADFDRKGVLAASRNLDKSGKVTTETVYFQDGSVKERKENIKRNGKVVTQVSRFNQNGQKLK